MTGPLVARCYRALVHLYPRSFRSEFGADMEQLLLDQLREERAAVVTARAIVDLAVTIPTQHLEAHMRTPNRLVPFAYLLISATGLAVAVLGGSEPVALIPGLLVALGAGVIGLVAWRRSSAVHESGVTAGWWKFLVAGPALIGGVIVAAGVGVEAWFVGMGVVVAGVGSVALGTALGIAHLFKTHAGGVAA